MAEGMIVRDVVPKTKTRKLKYYNCPRCPCGQCTRKRLRRAHADMTSYGRGYDRRGDVVSKTEIRKFKYYNCPRWSVRAMSRKRLRRAHAVDYRRECWWATPVVKSSTLVVSSRKLTKRVAGFVWKHAQYIPAEKLRLGGPGAARTDFSPKQRFIESRRLLTMRRVRSDDASPETWKRLVLAEEPEQRVAAPAFSS
jgi:hypothetical protein